MGYTWNQTYMGSEVLNQTYMGYTWNQTYMGSEVLKRKLMQMFCCKQAQAHLAYLDTSAGGFVN